MIYVLCLTILSFLGLMYISGVCSRLINRQKEPWVRRGRIQETNFLVVTDVSVQTSTVAGAAHVAVEVLTQIDCNQEAKTLGLMYRSEVCSRLINRQKEPRVRRGRIQGKNFLVVTDVSVQTSTQASAAKVAVEVLTQIDCNQEAKTLGQHFVDRHRLQLIQRVSSIASILDELLDQKVIQQERYDKIRSMSTPQEKMRELYSWALRATESCKDVFYKALKKHEPYLMEELENL